MRCQPVPVLEIGGSHVTAAWVSPLDWAVEFGDRIVVQPGASADVLIESFVRAGNELSIMTPGGRDWGVAIPGPFDYRRGVARFEGVGKFESLYGCDVGNVLRSRITPTPVTVTFINDASAFVLGEWLAGQARGVSNCVGITIGSGIGSAFLRDGVIVEDGPDVPPSAEVHLLRHRGQPLEQLVSRRALLARYRQGGGGAGIDVREMAEAARCGDQRARQTFATAFTRLGQVLGPWLARFGAQVLVVGGSIAAAWDLLHEPLLAGLASAAADVQVRASAAGESSALIGTAYTVLAASGSPQ